MTTENIFKKVKEKFGEAVLAMVSDKNIDTFINISPEFIKEISMFLRDDQELYFDYLVNLTGMDYKDSLGIVYHLYSLKHNHRLILKVKLEREHPIIPSVERVWKTANWHEREAYDMFGIFFENHPDLQRILCPKDWIGFPLRKDYVAPTEYNGMDVTPNSI